MWIDQRDRDTNSGWIWGSIIFHAAIIVYFVMSPGQNTPEPSAPNKGSETVTMTVTESKGSDEAAEIAVAQAAEEPVPVKKPVVAKAKPKKKKAAVVKALPKKEVVEEKPDEDKMPLQAVVIPETTPLENITEQSLDEEVAKLQDNPEALGTPGTPGTEMGQQASAQPAMPAQGTADGLAGSQGNAPGSESNPRSYLDLKQKPGNVPPQYPEAARLNGEQGKTDLRYFVDESGKVSNVQVVKSSGSEALDNEAVKAISQYQYEPGQSGWAAHPISYSLKGPQTQTPGRLRTAGHP